MNGSERSSARDTILARVREALRVAAPLPHLKSRAADGTVAAAAVAGTAPLSQLTVLPVQAGRPWLPDGGETLEERLTILTENLARLRAELIRLPSIEAASVWLAAAVRDRGWRQVAWHGDPQVEQAMARIPKDACSTYRIDGSAGFDKQRLECCDAGITSCEAIVAQTGSILVSSRTSGGRAISILPHVHVVVASTAAVVSTLGDALEDVGQRSAGRLPSMLSFITGPSRTGDIERILVLGAHGPKELLVLLVG